MQMVAVLESLGATSVRELERKSRWAIQRAWRAAFAGEWQDWTGPLQEIDWHVVSYAYVPRLAGANAQAAFEREAATQLTVALSLADGPTYECDFACALSFGALRSAWAGDLYLFPMSMDWTFVITHEGTLGPYFATAPDEARGR